MKRTSLDDLYHMTSYVYGEQNAIRPISSTLAHFVEVCGMLTTLDRRKKKEGFDFVDALCKALGWYFPLLAKLKVRSVQDLVFRKFPYACPYCRKTPHDERVCKTVKGTETTVDHHSLRRIYTDNLGKQPHSLDEWQHMFQEIYPRTMSDNARSTLGLFEELGELAEAVRVFERFPKYFAGEAADIFSYLMGLANEHSLRLEQEAGHSFNLHDEYLRRFPGLCLACGHRVCVCPAIPRATVGRLAKELDIDPSERLFDSSIESIMAEGRHAAETVLSEIGGIPKIIERFPTDRGDAHTALIVLLVKLSTEIGKSNKELAERFHAAAIELANTTSEAGSMPSGHYFATHEVLVSGIREAWRAINGKDLRQSIDLEKDSLAFRLGASLARVRILIVHASPRDTESIRVASEVRAIKQAVAAAGQLGSVEITDLPAATIDDLRRALLDQAYEIVHFAGHADEDSIWLETSEGSSSRVSLAALSELVGRYPSVRGVILNACDSLAKLSMPIGQFTIGMTKPVNDDSAIQFSLGFYDALARGKDVEFAVEEGKSTLLLKNLEPLQVKLLKRK